MLVTLSGMLMLVRLLHSLKPLGAIIFVFSFITHDVIESSLISINATYGFFPFPKYNPLSYSLYFKLMHLSQTEPPKKESPILVTLSGMLIFVRLLHPAKASSPMLVTLSGMVMLVRPSQLEKA